MLAMKASPNRLSRPELFHSFSQQAFLLGLLSFIFLLSLYSEYRQYQKLVQFEDYTTQAWVKQQYRKNGHWVLELISIEGFRFYTSSYDSLKPLEGQHLSVKMFTKELNFLEFIQGFYVPAHLRAKLPKKQYRFELMEALEQMHSKESASVYGALFFAGHIPKELREKLSALGINHLLAISGFHVGVLTLILFTLLTFVYKPFQSRFFPYRSSVRDISLVVLILLFVYVWFLDFTPSLLRAFGMSLFAYGLYDRGIKLLSFNSLFLVVCALIALWPKLVFALGFWFSVAGVFYIFVFLYYVQDVKPWQSFILLHLWVYLAMLPVVHYFFGSFSLHQLYSPLLTMLFIIFYPMALGSHMVGLPTLLDPVIEELLRTRLFVIESFTPALFFYTYLIISLLAVYKRFFFFVTLLFSLLFLVYLLYGVAEF